MNPAKLAELCQSLSLTDVDEPINLLSLNLKNIGEQKLELCLVGKLCMNRMVNRDAFRMIIPRIWKLTQDVDIEVIGANIFVFSFACLMDRRRVLGGGGGGGDHGEPAGTGELTKMRFDRVMFWIQIHNTPLLCMNKETCFFLGSLIGEVVEVDSSMVGWVMEIVVRVPPSISRLIVDGWGGLLGGVTSHVGVLLNDGRPGGKTSVVQEGHETNVEQGLLICSSKLRDSTSDHAEASRIKMGGPTAVIGSPLPFRFTGKMAVMQNIDPDLGAPFSVSSEKRSRWKRRARSSGAMVCDNENFSGVCLLSHGFAAVTLTRSSLTLKEWEWEDSNLIQERLDRCLCDLSCRFLFGDLRVVGSTIRRVARIQRCVRKLSSLRGLIRGQTMMVFCRILRVLHIGDRNTKFFHSHASAWRSTNKIAGLFYSSGVWHDSRCDMKHIIVDYFFGIFQKPNGGITDC
ncbi:hypothetical protein ACOSQ3_017301 [Xanthoceras sorbifolium]